MQEMAENGGGAEGDRTPDLYTASEWIAENPADFRQNSGGDSVNGQRTAANLGPTRSQSSFATEMAMNVSKERALQFLNHAFRNVDLPRLSQDDLGDIADGLNAFAKPLAEALRPFAEQHTIDEVMSGAAPRDWLDASAERRIEMMGERKAENTANILRARAALDMPSPTGSQ